MTQDEFLSLLGHELRGPLGAIAAATEVMRASDPSGSDASEAREVVQRQVERMGRALDGLVELGRLVARGVPATQRVNLANVLRELRGVSVAPDTADAWIETDGALLEDALARLAAFGSGAMRARIAGAENETAGVLTIEPVAGGVSVQFVRALLECAGAKVRFESGGRRLVADLPR